MSDLHRIYRSGDDVLNNPLYYSGSYDGDGIGGIGNSFSSSARSSSPSAVNFRSSTGSTSGSSSGSDRPLTPRTHKKPGLWDAIKKDVRDFFAEFKSSGNNSDIEKAEENNKRRDTMLVMGDDVYALTLSAADDDGSEEVSEDSEEEQALPVTQSVGKPEPQNADTLFDFLDKKTD